MTAKNEDKRAAFDFFMTATPEEVKDLGWRIGEKLDSFSVEDFMDAILKPFAVGMMEGKGK